MMDRANYNRATAYFRKMELEYPEKQWGEFADAMDEAIVLIDKQAEELRQLRLQLDEAMLWR